MTRIPARESYYTCCRVSVQIHLLVATVVCVSFVCSESDCRAVSARAEREGGADFVFQRCQILHGGKRAT